jgi:hypothetical protein
MSSKLDYKEVTTFADVLLSNAYTQDAMINVLEKKELISKMG